MSGQINIKVNETFGFLTVLSKENIPGDYVSWKCKCICGKETLVKASDLKRGHTKSCGCFGKDSFMSALSCLYSNYRRGALRRGLSFDISLERFRSIIAENCEYCGAEPFQKFHKKGARATVTYSGIDRKDNSVGYTDDNCIPCCGRCNFGKGSMTPDQFRDWIKQVYRFQFKTN